MAKKAARTRSVQSPKGKSSVSPREIERAIRSVVPKPSPPPGKEGSKRSERAAASQR